MCTQWLHVPCFPVLWVISHLFWVFPALWQMGAGRGSMWESLGWLHPAAASLGMVGAL